MSELVFTSSPAKRERKGARSAQQNEIGEGQVSPACPSPFPNSWRRLGPCPLPQAGED